MSICYKKNQVVVVNSKFLEKKNYTSSEQFNDKVLLNSTDYHKIFRKGFIKDQKAKPWKKGLLVIQSSDCSIIRLYYGSNAFNIKQGQIGLTVNSLNQLQVNHNKEIDYSITIKPAKPIIGRFSYYWNNPADHVRVSFKGAFWYCFLGVLATFITYIISLVNFY